MQAVCRQRPTAEVRILSQLCTYETLVNKFELSITLL
jgi:hypothetical protein